MPTRPTARCCRAAKHLRAPLDNIWITDSVLASAFERYCHVSRLSRRNSSSVPGPLENRKRLGKRRITGLYSADFQPTLPPWLIEFPADLTQWKWFPPTEPASRLKLEESPPQQSWSLLTWMDQLLPAEEALDYPGTGQDAPLESSDDFSDRLQEARGALAKSSGKLHPDFHLAMDRLQHDLYLGLLTVDAIPTAIASFTASISESTQEPQLARSASISLISAVINGMAFSRVQGLAQADSQLCNILLQRISELPANKTGAELLCTILTVAPNEHIRHLGQGLHAVLQTWLTAPAKAYEAAAPTIANALARISPKEHSSLLEGMESAALENNGSAISHDRRLRWLVILAGMPQIDTTYLIEACSRSACFSASSSPSSEVGLSHLLLQQWKSRGYLRNSQQVEKAWKQDAATSPELSLGSLAWNISNLEWPGDGGSNRIGLLMSLFRTLRSLDLFNSFLTSFEKYCRTRTNLGEAGFKTVALASKDHKTAVSMYELMKHHRGNKHAPPRIWAWNDWHPYIKPMILDPSIHPNLIWEVLHLQSPAELHTNRPSSRSSSLRRKTKQKLVANMATWFSQATHLSDRAALRHVSRCNAWLQAQGLPLPASGLEAVVRVAVRDLKRGEPGRTARLNWALDLTQRRLGAEQAEKTGRVLEMWRRRNSMLETKREN
ncbi:hypothetical protein ACHAQH_007438 [Verticillium albo-atrum]